MAFRRTVDLGGLNLSGVDPTTRAVFQTLALDGWSGSPASTLTVDQRSGASGGWASPNPVMRSRTYGLSGIVTHCDPERVSAALDILNDAVALDAVKMTVGEGDRRRWSMVQRQDEILVDDSDPQCAKWSVQLVAADPFKYDDPFVVSTAVPSTTGGLAIPTDVPFAITSTVATGSCSALNPGNATGPVRMRIDGPITGPVITHIGSGLALVFAASLTIAAGEWLDIDMQRRTVLANGTASRNGWVTSRGWSGFEKGPNTWSLAAVASSPGALLTVTATPAWK